MSFYDDYIKAGGVAKSNNISACIDCGGTLAFEVQSKQLDFAKDGLAKEHDLYCYAVCYCGGIPGLPYWGNAYLTPSATTPIDFYWPSYELTTPTKPAPKKCRCDLRSVIMVTGCKCGGI